jgi:hypothetical protein
MISDKHVEIFNRRAVFNRLGWLTLIPDHKGKSTLSPQVRSLATLLHDVKTGEPRGAYRPSRSTCENTR